MRGEGSRRWEAVPTSRSSGLIVTTLEADGAPKHCGNAQTAIQMGLRACSERVRFGDTTKVSPWERAPAQPYSPSE